MPYLTAVEYKRAKRLIKKKPVNRQKLALLEEKIYALNKRIRNVPGTEPNAEWLDLMAQHRILVHVYHQAGGDKFW